MKKIKMIYGRIKEIEDEVNDYLDDIEEAGQTVISIQTSLDNDVDLPGAHALVTIFYSN